MLTDQVISPSDVYWITRLDSISVLLLVLAVAAIAGTVGYLIAYFCFKAQVIDIASRYYSPEDMKHLSAKVARPTASAVSCLRVFWTLLPISIGLGCAMAALPSTKEMCAILVIPKLANNQEIQGLGTDVVGLARAWLYELKPKESK